MSIQAVAWALEQNVGDPAAKLVLISLANAFNQQRGRCFPTVQQIARDASMSERSVVRKIRHLCDSGMVQVTASFDSNGRQTSNEYLLLGFGHSAGGGGGCQSVTLGRVSACHPGEGDNSVRGEGDTFVREEGDRCVTPLKEPEETPEEGTGRTSTARARNARKDRPVAANDDTPLAALQRVLDEEHARAVVEHRKGFKGHFTPYAARLLAKKFEACDDPNAAADAMIANGWQGFEPAWMERSKSRRGQPASRGPPAGVPSVSHGIAAWERIRARLPSPALAEDEPE